MMDVEISSLPPNGGKRVGVSGDGAAGTLGKVNRREDQGRFLVGAIEGTATIPGRVGLNGGMDCMTENASGGPAFMDEKQLLAKLPISRRTLGNWKASGVLPYIKIGRRCLYDWASVHGALLRRQRGGQ